MHHFLGQKPHRVFRSSLGRDPTSRHRKLEDSKGGAGGHFSRYSQTNRSKSMTSIIGLPRIIVCAKKTMLQQIIFLINQCLDHLDLRWHLMIAISNYSRDLFDWWSNRDTTSARRTGREVAKPGNRKRQRRDQPFSTLAASTRCKHWTATL